MPYTSYLLRERFGLKRHDPDTRAQLALSFRTMYRSLGLDLAGCAQLLHVSERTLHNWESGKHDIPYATYRLLRLLNRMELPGESWDGWCFHGGVLWSPEGHPFTGKDGSHWALLVRQAKFFPEMLSKVADLEQQLRQRTGAEGASRADTHAQAKRAGGAAGEATRHPAAAGGRREAPALDLSHKHFGTSDLKIPANGPSYAIKSVAFKVAA